MIGARGSDRRRRESATRAAGDREVGRGAPRVGRVVGAAAVLGLAAVLVTRGATLGRAATSPTLDTVVLAKSIAFFESRFASDPWNHPLGGRLIGRYLLRFQLGADMGDLERAERVARQLLRVAPDTAEAHARLAGILLAQHRFEEAMAAAAGAIAADSADQGGLAALFDAALAAGRYDLAESALEALEPRGLHRLVREAHWLDAIGEADGAFAALDRSCRALAHSAFPRPVLAWCLTELAGIEHRRSGVVAARRLLDSALAVQPAYRGALEGLADLAHAQGDCAGAAARYDEIAADAHPDLYLRLAECLVALGRADAARRYEGEFLRVATGAGAEPLNAPELILFYADQPAARDTALAIALREVERRPTVESWDLLSWVRYRRGEIELALQASDRARKWGAPSATMDYHRARILEAAGREAEGAALRLTATHRLDLLEPHARRDHLAR